MANYDPYGLPLELGGDFNTSLGFTEEMTDPTGLVYLRARYMSPQMGMFLTKDPFEGVMQRVMSRNGYSYVEGNPVNNTDPSGKFVFIYMLAKAAIGAGAGAVLNAIVYDAAARRDCGCGYRDWASTTDRAQFILEGAAWGGIGGALMEVAAATRVLVGAADVVTGAQAVANRLPSILEDVIAGREINKCEALEAALGALGIVVGQRLVRSNIPGAVREIRQVARGAQRLTNRILPPDRNPNFTRFDPRFPGRPDPAWSIDTRGFTSGPRTARGGIRNARQFGLDWIELDRTMGRNTLSPDNIARVTGSPFESPIVDAEWLRYFPEHRPFEF